MIFKRSFLIFGLIFIAIFVVSAGRGVFAEDLGQEAVNNRKAQLEKELEYLEAQIDGYGSLIQSKQKESASLQRDIDVFNAKIQKTKLEIQKLDITIANASSGISKRNSEIDFLQEKADRVKESLAELVRKNNEMDDVTVVEMILGNEVVSDFFVITDSFASVQKSIHVSLEDIRDTNDKLGKEIDNLEKEKAEKNRLKMAQEMNRKSLAASEAEKKEMLNVTKGLEKNYAKILEDKHREAAKIRSALFALRDTAAIPFGEAYGYALEAQKKTGVRPAFLLAILTQESNLGENTGQCLVTDFKTGDGVGKNTGRVFKGIMKPSRDVTPFLDLANRLSFDPKTKPVSCPQTGGYGGAMGPSQFIPSTWNIYEKKISAATGVVIPDPWIPRDAFFASAIYLADLGAGKGTYNAEHEAAARYYAGGGWYKASGQGYGTSVLRHAQNIQENMIDPLNLY
ncbi:TPA: hypothetical protein DEW47_02245 [Patescibacteria group bacterium]|nr:MAG: Peptidoglycan DL-endopeptidase CwlO [Parcubacteria group bacterium GW2011_GWF2_40_10]KKR47701.1 MAG: Peptidoglycan DL-endopeptidase CwlO [Parcubacteria group bacterium GW2011_GWA2_40_143]KKR60045.1 MAG: Peptidoglycan DL-endopeptidase CwlO [Parcubacteria group bacterium GW2011_GWC2_40_31]KKR74463.1 MAG: Peptidoglycan DL-endopeptidase CwlO [Parcubacteria group bacterium GW2011_GWB2_40_8]KKR77119.1 MAG: Peptidoglycan DL-endopeptidase CwlO [Parcubacteria group bacterium GW2011_GWE2_40_8]HB